MMMDDKKTIVEEGEEMPPPPAPTSQEKADIEKLEEQKLKSKFPSLPNRPLGGGGGHSSFLQKRLAKGQKYFDSGDYQMAQQKQGRMGPGRMAMPVLAQTGEAHPTPDSVPARKTSIIQPLHDHSSHTLHLSGDNTNQPPAMVPGQPLPNPAIAKLST
jgi:hypothetical protein